MNRNDVSRIVGRVDRAARKERLESPQVVQGPRSVRHHDTVGGTFFEVIRSAVYIPGDGLYDCVEADLDATHWGNTTGLSKFNTHNRWENDVWYEAGVEIYCGGGLCTCILPHEGVAPPNPTYWLCRWPPNYTNVLNMNENHPVSSYTPALGVFDILYAWQIFDDENNKRWVGIPLGPSVRRLKTTESAPAAKQITCNLMLNDGSEAQVNDLGYNVEVYCEICNGTALNEAVSRLASGDYLQAQNIRGEWRCTAVFQGTEECDCYSAS